ncbi:MULTISPECIES: dienelactone hydrolase family protein [unclassified Streptomyces]|uniref:dienelactone hydrolase family protein n=1 Tax=unclassified Streptomyces TaxID=2593676 RepID=UPI002254BC20|nr:MULTISPECIES: dienelactone hydrolase family protein [unclassified Streptomyces]MCX4528655.1 dienelactone hydrolase family protein [Streptomyces sp. NBC_01551]MCX4540738.1 dienelactone hydrolase family protein [Streptomyces sp. NBC_01565]
MSGTAPVSTLDGWRRARFAAGGLAHDCYEKGDGPGVVLMPEVPGITPEVIGLGEHLVGAGFTVVMPSLFGVPGRPGTLARTALVSARVCVSSEFRAFATNARRPIADYLRALARDLAARTPAAGVGVIGLCFTGGFALAAAVDDSVLAPVLSQPSVPVPVGAARRADAGVSQDELRRVVDRTRDEGLCVLGLRFSGDPLSPEDRFATLRARLGDAFRFIRLDSAAGNPDGFGRLAHSVLTLEVRESPDHPAFRAREDVTAFLRERLGVAAAG